MQKKHIDDVQTQTVDEHFKLVLEDKSTINLAEADITPDDLPDWYNKNLYKEGQNFYNRNIMSVAAAGTVGLVLVFAVDTILKILLYTKRSSSTCAAFKRYIETLLHVHYFYTCDSNDVHSKWYKSMNTICRLHKTNSKRTKKAGIGEISQRDMALTQYGFMGFIFIAPKAFGLNTTLEEIEAFNHFWRVTGYMLGISDRFNLCRKNAKETTELCHKIKGLYANYLTNLSSEFYDVMSYALDALWYVDITADKDSFMAFTHRLHGLPYKKLGWYSWLISKYREWLFYLLLIPYVRVPVRMYTNLIFSFILWSSENFPILAWIYLGKDNVRINLHREH